jgi:predicted RNase H-like HicB family nuclease
MNDNILQQAQLLASRPYPFRVYKDDTADKDIQYLAVNIDLEGCMAQGGSIKEALRNLDDARVDYISFLLERGDSVPEPSSLAVYVETTSKPGLLSGNVNLSTEDALSLSAEQSEVLYEASLKTSG